MAVHQPDTSHPKPFLLAPNGSRANGTLPQLVATDKLFAFNFYIVFCSLSLNDDLPPHQGCVLARRYLRSSSINGGLTPVFYTVCFDHCWYVLICINKQKRERYVGWETDATNNILQTKNGKSVIRLDWFMNKLRQTVKTDRNIWNLAHHSY